MITILFHMTVKPERQAEFEMLTKDMMPTTRPEDGCIAYTIYRRADQSRDFGLLEQWRDADALTAHLGVLRRRFGLPDDQEPHPETHHRRRLPKAFLTL
jgi:antibiotic biosynthesis monooxygenase (ABM) superfamily enzyme